MSIFRIGFLSRSDSFTIPGCQITAVPRYAEAAEQIKSCALKQCSLGQGFIYGEPGQHLFRLPVSHEITLDDGTYSVGTGREVAAFVTHFLGLLHGGWLQFEDWWFDRRVPVDPHESFHLTTDEVGRVLEIALRTWLSWKPAEQARMTNALFMHCRSQSYDWEWERFGIDYWVTDALWRTAEETGRAQQRKQKTHANRMNTLCDDLDLHEDPQRVCKIVELRNDLMHEALWDGGQPGTARSNISIEAPANLRRFNVRVFLALLGIDAGFVGSAWCYMGTFAFKLKN